MRVLDAVRDSRGGFDVDAWHVMDQRDNALIADELLYGSGSSKFIYNFEIKGTPVIGISVVGARHLAAYYGGMKHRMVGSIQKIGSLFTFTSYPCEGVPMQVQCSVIHDLAEEPDFYGAIVEVTDIKTGNTIMTEVRENRFEKTRAGAFYERPHYATIAQSKAYRNGVLALVRQDIQIEWKLKQLALDKSEVITGSVIEEKRAGVLKFAAAKAITVNRAAVEALTMDQIAGLAEAARAGGVEQFREAALSLKVMGAVAPEQEPAAKTAATTLPSATSTQQTTKPATATASNTAQTATMQREAPAKKPAEPAKEPEPPQIDQLYLVNGDDEMAGGPYATPLAYAQALAAFVKEAFPADRAAILEHNDEFMGPAAHASKEAEAIIHALVTGEEVDDTDPRPEAGLKPKEDDTPQQQPNGWVVTVPQRTGGKPDLPAYLAAARASLTQHVTTDAGLAAWRAANKPTYDAMPKATRFGVDAAVAEHRKAVGLDKAPAAAETPDPAAAASQAPADAETEDKAAAWASAAIATIDAMTSGGDALRWIDANSEDMAWLKKSRAELHADVRAAVARKQGG